jgi:hypothetical protein
LRWTKYELEIQDYKIKSNDHKIYYALTFYYDFEEEDDEVFFAYCPPYTYTNLMDNIQLIQKN